MKKFLLLGTLFCFLNVSIFAQTKAEKMATMHQAKVAEIVTEQFGLVGKNAQRFMEEYKGYLAVKAKLLTPPKYNRKEFDAMDNKDVEKILDQKLDNENKFADTRTDYFGKFKKVVPLKQLYKLDSVEDMASKKVNKMLAAKKGKKKRN